MNTSFKRARVEDRLPKEWRRRWNFDEELTDFETEIVRKNPYYLLFAFKLSERACEDLAKETETPPLSEEARAYLVAWNVVENGRGSASSEELRAAFERERVDVEKFENLAALRPFGGEVLVGHELENVDLSKTSYGEACASVKSKGTAFAKIREKRAATNPFVRAGGGGWEFDRKKRTLAERLSIMAKKT